MLPGVPLTRHVPAVCYDPPLPFLRACPYPAAILSSSSPLLLSPLSLQVCTDPTNVLVLANMSTAAFCPSVQSYPLSRCQVNLVKPGQTQL